MQKFLTKDQTSVFHIYLNWLWPPRETGDIASWIFDLAQSGHFQIHNTVNEIARDLIAKYNFPSTLQILFVKGSEFTFVNCATPIDIHWPYSLSPMYFSWKVRVLCVHFHTYTGAENSGFLFPVYKVIRNLYPFWKLIKIIRNLTWLLGFYVPFGLPLFPEHALLNLRRKRLKTVH